MKIAVGTTRRPKVEAVDEALRRIRRRTGWPARRPQVLSRDVSWAAPSMPVGVEELTRGAFERVRQLRRDLAPEEQEVDLWIGMEGGFTLFQAVDDPQASAPGRQVFLESWVYVEGSGQEPAGYYARSGGIPIPRALAAMVLEEGLELGEAIDDYAGHRDVRSRMGTWGILTRDLVSRRDSFVTALIAALAPFYNAAAYRRIEPEPTITSTKAEAL
ncbi:MAG TPA: inosine/xanthosine triphosphatase [Acidobacteriota bacterium]|nr:inosine/xanthosine triphosphatase [Acidobacteriota bacterium]